VAALSRTPRTDCYKSAQNIWIFHGVKSVLLWKSRRITLSPASSVVGNSINNCFSRGRSAGGSRGCRSGASPRPRLPHSLSGSPIVATIAFTAMGIYILVEMASYPNTVRTWRRVAALALVLSSVPNVLLANSHIMVGDWPKACALMTMHVVVWAICVTILPSMALTKRPRKAQDLWRFSLNSLGTTVEKCC
jgi:hypothetical protein